MKKRSILLCDDDDGVREALSFILEEDGHTVVAFESALSVLEHVDGLLSAAAPSASLFDVVITDLRMPKMNGIELVRALRERIPEVPVLVITAYGDVDTAVQAMQAGAVDFAQKPISREALRLTLAKILRHKDVVAENVELRARLQTGVESGLLAMSDAMLQAIALCDQIAPTDATVLILGESGTGKELIAKRLHQKSNRKDANFVALNCSALPADLLESELFGHAKGAFTGAVAAKRGRFVDADGGTLFLDEIGDLPLALQAKLLRVLQEGEVDVVGGSTVSTDVRIVAATHRNLSEMVGAGEFREDLFFRLHVVPLTLPPLRERREDIAPLFSLFLERASRATGRPPPVPTKGLLIALEARRWPGNVRELENMATRLAVTATSDVLDNDALPQSALPQGEASRERRDKTGRDEIGLAISEENAVLELPPDGISLDALERSVVVAALAASKGNQSRAARFLKVPRHVILYRIEKYAIGEKDWGPFSGSPRARIESNDTASE